MSHCVRPMTSIGSSHLEMGLYWILGGSLLLLLLPAPSLWRRSPPAGILVASSVAIRAAAGVAAVIEEGKAAEPLTELVAILVAPATVLVFEGTCPTSVGAGASSVHAEAAAEAPCGSVDLLDASDIINRLTHTNQ